MFEGRTGERERNSKTIQKNTKKQGRKLMWRGTESCLGEVGHRNAQEESASWSGFRQGGRPMVFGSEGVAQPSAR